MKVGLGFQSDCGGKSQCRGLSTVYKGLSTSYGLLELLGLLVLFWFIRVTSETPNQGCKYIRIIRNISIWEGFEQSLKNFASINTNIRNTN